MSEEQQGYTGFKQPPEGTPRTGLDKVRIGVLEKQVSDLQTELAHVPDMAALYRKGWDAAAANVVLLQADLDKLRWIPVAEGLPKEQDHKDACGHSINVWCYYGNLGLPERKKLGIPTGYDTDIYHLPSNTWMSGITPTHWMPIPTLPEKE